MTNALGKHVIAELWVRNPHRLNDPDLIKDALLAACERGEFKVLNVSTHASSPHGVTAIVLLSELGIPGHRERGFRSKVNNESKAS